MGRSDHRFDSFEWLNGAQKNSGTYAGRFACYIQQEPTAVTEIDVSVAALQKKRAIATRLPDKCMSGGVTDRIGFRFYDAAAEPDRANVVDQNFADQVAC